MSKKTKIAFIISSIAIIVLAFAIIITKKVPSTYSSIYESEFDDRTVQELRFVSAKLTNNEFNVNILNTKSIDFEVSPIDVIFKNNNKVVAKVRGYIGEKMSPNELKNLNLKTDIDLSNVDNIEYDLVDTILITYNGNGGTPSKANDTIPYKGSITNFADSSKEMSNDYLYTLEGWYTEPDGGEKVTSSTKFIVDTTLYAHYNNHARRCNYNVTTEQNSEIYATYSCVDGVGTMISCSYQGIECDGGLGGDPNKFNLCINGGSVYASVACKTSFPAVVVNRGTLKKSISCACE